MRSYNTIPLKKYENQFKKKLILKYNKRNNLHCEMLDYLNTYLRYLDLRNNVLWVVYQVMDYSFFYYFPEVISSKPGSQGT